MSDESGESEKSVKSGGLDLSHGMEVPFADPALKAINTAALSLLERAWNSFKIHLGTLTEPFFRVGMGERYFTWRTNLYAVGLWIVVTGLSYFFPEYVSGARYLSGLAHFYRLEEFFDKPIIPVLTGALMAIVQLIFGLQNLQWAAKCRKEGISHHTRTRGIPRWGFLRTRFFIIFVTFLLLFNAGIAVLFLAGWLMNLKLKVEQDAAIMARYQDVMDAELEKRYLRDAALGKCPTEISYLFNPLSERIKPEVRENIADALAGTPVTGLAKPRNKMNRSRGDSPLAPPANLRAGKKSPDSGAKPVAAVPSQQVDIKAALQEAQGTAKETLVSILRSKRVVQFAVTGLLLLALVAIGAPVVRFVRAQMSRPAPVAATAPSRPPRANPPGPIQTVSAAPVVASAPVVGIAPALSNSAAIAPGGLEAQKRDEQAKADAALEEQKRQAALETLRAKQEELRAIQAEKKREETKRLVEQMKAC